jgi:HEAT repeat protein
MAAARDSDDLDFGWSVAWATQAFESVATVEDYLAALRHPNVHVRWATALALGHCAEERVVAPLIAALGEDGPVTQRSWDEIVPENYYRKVAHCAAMSLRRLGPLAMPALLEALRSADDPLIRAGAASALTGALAPEAFDPLLVAVTHDTDVTVRRHALQAMASLVPALVSERQALEARNTSSAWDLVVS